jgi:uncharacterized RDD family membrane protein YckC
MDTDTKYQVFWKRYWAYVIDIALIGAFMIGAVQFTSRMLMPFIFIFWAIAWFSYRVFFHQLTGQTIGKRVVNIIVLDKDEKQFLSEAQSLKREILPIIIGLIALYLIIYEHSLQPKYGLLDIPSLRDTSQFMRDTSFSLDRVNKFLDEYENVKAQENRPSDILWYSTLIWTAIVCVSVLLNSKLRGIHDIIAKSVVVKKEVWERENEERHLTEGENNGSHSS